MSAAASQACPPYDRFMVALHLDSMEDQKNKLQAMLIAIRAAAPSDDFNLCCLIEVAKDIVEEHGAWHQIRNCLGMKREDQQ